MKLIDTICQSGLHILRTVHIAPLLMCYYIAITCNQAGSNKILFLLHLSSSPEFRALCAFMRWRSIPIGYFPTLYGSKVGLLWCL